jgi:hypothetical protein
MSIAVDKVHEIYKNIEALKKSALSTEDKAFKLRQIFESVFANYFNRTDTDEFIPLRSLFSDYIRVSGKFELKNFGHSLIGELNHWAHYKQMKLDPIELNKYFDNCTAIVQKITGIEPDAKVNESTSIDDFFKHIVISKQPNKNSHK